MNTTGEEVAKMEKVKGRREVEKEKGNFRCHQGTGEEIPMCCSGSAAGSAGWSCNKRGFVPTTPDEA